MSLFIGLPNLNLTSARIEVYPDHIEFGASEHSGSGVSVYMSSHEMALLGKALIEKVPGARGITKVVSHSRDAATDEISDMITNWVGDQLPDMHEDDTINLAGDIMDLVVDRLGSSIPGSLTEAELS